MRDRAAKTLTLSNTGHTATLLDAFGMEISTPSKALMASGVNLTRTGEDLLPEGKRYAESFGSLLFLSTTTRPDIAFTVEVLSRIMSCPEQDHMRAAKDVPPILRGTTRLGVVYGGSEPRHGFVDADWLGDIDGRRSTTGFVFTLNGGPIAWARKRKTTVATSTAEAEYVAAVMAAKKALWVRKLLSALAVDGRAVPMAGDKQACLTLVKNMEATGRTKHEDVAYHMVRDSEARGEVTFYFLPGVDMPEDGLTKPLPAPALILFRRVIRIGVDLGTSGLGATPTPGLRAEPLRGRRRSVEERPRREAAYALRLASASRRFWPVVMAGRSAGVLHVAV